jgi:hypothetical protein
MTTNTIPFEELALDDAMQTYPVAWATVCAILDGYDVPGEVKARIVSLVCDTCPHCFEHARGCQCWNDE